MNQQTTTVSFDIPRSTYRMKGAGSDTKVVDATNEDFEVDPWMHVVPFFKKSIDDWTESNWVEAIEWGQCPWREAYIFASRTEWGRLIPFPDGAFAPRRLNLLKAYLGYARSKKVPFDLTYTYVTSSPRVWSITFKDELMDCASSNRSLQMYPFRGRTGLDELSPVGCRPQAVHYCCLRVQLEGFDFFRVLCVAVSNAERTLVEGSVLVTRNLVNFEPRQMGMMSKVQRNNRRDLIRGGRVDDPNNWWEVEDYARSLRETIVESLLRIAGFVRLVYRSDFSPNGVEQLHFGSTLVALFGVTKHPKRREVTPAYGGQ